MIIFNYIPFVGFLFIVLSLIIKIWRIKKKSIILNSGKGKNKQFYFFFFGIIFLLWLVEIIHPVFFNSYSILPEIALKIWIDSKLLQIIGSLIILLSLVLWIITLFHFKTSLRFDLDENNSGTLVTTGIFALSRNPFFLSLNLYFTGIALINANLFFIAFAVLAIISIHFFILKEEKFLKKVYGEDYLNYSKKVRRYF